MTAATSDRNVPTVSADEPRPAPGATDTHAAPGPTRGASVVIGSVRLYQLLRTGHTSPCRFVPTCSQFAVEAVERHGLRHGLRLTLGRLGRCRPGGPFGSDPVPE